MSAWPQDPDGTNKTIGEMTEDERRPLLRAAFLRSKLSHVPEFSTAFAGPSKAHGTSTPEAQS